MRKLDVLAVSTMTRSALLRLGAVSGTLAGLWLAILWAVARP
ncbi:hypothetical protein [Bradyrhizobium sp. WSM3983]|nr:hypothetical protein [Bradyrhizobium sp. WSM3983]